MANYTAYIPAVGSTTYPTQISSFITISEAFDTEIEIARDGEATLLDNINLKLNLSGGAMTGTITNFTSTGIDDNATTTAITIDASQAVTFSNIIDTRTNLDVYAKAETYSNTEVYNKTETYSNTEVYSKEESDSKADMAFRNSLAKLIHPDLSQGLQELQAQGVFPSSFNQQWGGMGYGGLPDGTLGEIATGYLISDGGSSGVQGGIGADQELAENFKVSQSGNYTTFFARLSKASNPTDNLVFELRADSSGPTGTLLATATAINSKTITDNADGEWVKITFPSTALTADTIYFLKATRSGSRDTTNRVNWLRDTTFYTYPHGGRWENESGTWTDYSTNGVFCFLAVPVTTILSTGLTNFDGALHCYEGAPLNQSGGFYFKNSKLNHKRGTLNIAGTGWDKDKTFYDSSLATDNNRIVLRCNVTTGFAQVDLYENDGTKHTITGTTDISTGNHIVGIRYRAEGDGSDFLTLYVDGASEGTPLTSQTITLDRAFEDGHTSIGGGFPLAPTWTDDEDMSVLPSASGWTWTGSATEANAMVASGGVLHQNGAGYGSAETGYYAKTTTLNNATGWIVESKIKITNNSNTTGQSDHVIRIQDGTKVVWLFMHEYFIDLYDGTVFGKVQLDLTKETVIKIIGKGSDFYIYADNVLIFDGTGLLDAATATNQIYFGDDAGGAGFNTTAEWHYFKYYEGVYLPEYSTMQMSELANWNADKSSLLSTIYNSGVIQSVKSLAGMNENYVKTEKQVISVKGVVSAPFTGSTTAVPLDDMAAFSFGSMIRAEISSTMFNSVSTATTSLTVSIDGNINDDTKSYAGTSNVRAFLANNLSLNGHSGLHFSQGLYFVTSGTGSGDGVRRTLNVEAE